MTKGICPTYHTHCAKILNMNKELEAYIDLIQTSKHRGFRAIIANRIARIAVLYAETENEVEKVGEMFCKEYNNFAGANYANQQKWISEKPEFKDECIVIAASLFRNEWSYTLFQVKKVDGDDGWYLGWLTGDGDEYGDLADLHADKYLILPLLQQPPAIETKQG
jgi:hypothetical protein